MFIPDFSLDKFIKNNLFLKQGKITEEEEIHAYGMHEEEEGGGKRKKSSITFYENKRR